MALTNNIGGWPNHNTESIPIDAIDWQGIANACWCAGHVPLPKSRESGIAGKRPIGAWKSWQTRRPTVVENWTQFGLDGWGRPPAGMCLLTGSIAGWLEVIDFDQAAAWFARWFARIEASAPGLSQRLVWQRTMRAGLHGVYRWEYDGRTPPSGQKLARGMLDGEVETFIETRAEGNLIVAAPTPGYALLSGDWCHLPTITAAERDTLIGAALSLNAIAEVPAVEIQRATVPPRDTDVLRPGDDWLLRGDVRELLHRHGWRHVGYQHPNELWRRPGKRAGHSATWNGSRFHCFSQNANARPLLHVSERRFGYDALGLLAALEHGGDISAATRWLRANGFGGEFPRVDECGIDFSGLIGITTELR
jgi:hypothetical protein